MERLKVLIKILRPETERPFYRHDCDSGFDLVCAENCLVPANACALLPTGLAFAIPPGYEMQIRMRSGTAKNTPLIIPNAPGTIDSGYRGEVKILVRNLDSKDFHIPAGTRIAQGIIAPVIMANFEITSELDETERGDRGFGSSGIF